MLFASGTGKIGSWQGSARATLAAWQTATFGDDNSVSQDPLFVDADGADNILGYAAALTADRTTTSTCNRRSAASEERRRRPILNSIPGLPVFANSSVTADAAQSPAIDRGNPTDSFANEPAPAGGFINLGWDGNTALASLSPAQYVLVTKPDGGETAIAGQTFPIRWRSQDMNSTVTIELLHNGNPTPVLTIASGVANSGQFSWSIPGNVTPANDYIIRITRADLPGSPDSSNAPFAIAAPTTVYYVNDGTVQAGDWTTAPGNDANDGLTPATPKASIRAILTAYQLGSGDVIRVDAGTYDLTTNIVILNDESGATIMGYNDPTFPGPAGCAQPRQHRVRQLRVRFAKRRLNHARSPRHQRRLHRHQRRQQRRQR